MEQRKYCGILKEIAGHPAGDLAGLLADRLQVPLDKAEALAVRIRKEHPQTVETQKVSRLLEKALESQEPAKALLYSVGCLSQKEFGIFMQWLLEELGYEVQDRCAVDWGFDYVAKLNDEKVSVLARKYPEGYAVSDAIFLVSQQIQSAHGCSRSIVAATASFTKQAAQEAQMLGVELWDSNVLAVKTIEAKQNARKIEQASLPPFQGSLLCSLLKLGEAKIFLVERKSEGKYDLILPGVRYPLLSFEVDAEKVARCLLRIKYNEPVSEGDAEQLISTGDNGNRVGPDEAQAYESITQYLSQFLE